jgi:hypothetical protein
MHEDVEESPDRRAIAVAAVYLVVLLYNVFIYEPPKM